MAVRRDLSAWRTGNDSKSSTTIAYAASTGATAAIGFRAQLSANAYSAQFNEFLCCTAFFVGSDTPPAKHLLSLCDS